MASRGGSGGGGRRGGKGGGAGLGRGDPQPYPGGAPNRGRGRGRGGDGRGSGGEPYAPRPGRSDQYAAPPASSFQPGPRPTAPVAYAQPGPRPTAPVAYAQPGGPRPTAPVSYDQPGPRPTVPVAARTADLASSSAAPPPVEKLEQAVRGLTLGQPAAAEPVVVAAAAPPVLPPASSKAMRHPARPGYGTVGKRCVVRANHFLVEIDDNDLYHYDVSITPEVTSRALNRAIMRELVSLYGESHFGRKKPAYDGRKSLYTAGKLPFESKDFVVKLPEKEKTSRVDKDYRVAVKYAGSPDLHHLKQFLKGRQMDVPQETIQVLDVVLRETPSRNYTIVSRSFFSTIFGHRGDIGDGLECWRGYYQSLRPTQMGLSLNIDISATSFYKPVPVIDFVAEYLNLRDISRPLNDNDRIRLKRVLKSIRVEVTHMRGSVRKYKIQGLTPLPLNQLTFVDDTGAKISVVSYFRKKYDYTLRHLNWPCLQSGSETRPTYLPMEVCKILEGQRYAKKLNDRQVTAILKATCKRPPEREASIRQMVEQNNYNNDEFANEFGMRVLNQLAQVEARVLPPPKLKYHESGREKMCNPSVGQWNMINKKMVNGGTINSWTCINFSRLQMPHVHQFCTDLVNMCNTIGMSFNPNPLIPPRSAHPNSIEAALRDIHSQSSDVFNHQGVQGRYLQLLIVVLPEMSGSYGTIKRICETELGIVSQCCQPRQVSKSNKQYLENVSLKVNVKVGGRNTVLVDAFRPNGIPNVSDRPTIIFGADVTHPPPGEDSQSSIAAVVASMDWPEVTKYRSLASAQQHRQEIIKDLFTVSQDPQRGTVNGGLIRDHLVAFYRATNQKPHRIIFFRDGVSEGQFSQVLLEEMDAIRKACASLQEGYLPPVTFVVVQKRHHTRLFPANHGNRDLTDRSGNILPGTVVDTKICHPTEFDFYLCSHAGIQGTSRPSHYHVLYDENKFTADSLQTLINNLCYTYARCTRSVSVVPPAYYAHLAAFRARYYSEGDSDWGSSTAGGAKTRERTGEVRALPKIKDNVMEVMFYC